MKLFKKKRSKGGVRAERTILMNHLFERRSEVKIANKKYPNNEVISSHYTWWNFIFMNLFEQYHNVANFFFVIISILYFYAETPIDPGTTIGPLVVVVSISMIKDAVDDVKRHLSDRKVNLQPFLVWKHFEDTQDSGWTPVAAKKIRPGDLVLCREDESFPCDLIVLASNNSNGKVYETTGNLDGESAIKTIYSLAATQKPFSQLINVWKTPEQVNQVREVKFPPTKLICQEPTDDFKVFEGRLECEDGTIPVSTDNIVFRGAVLRVTGCIVGVAVYTGKESKLSLNAKAGKHKFSSTMGRFNTILLIFMVFMLLFTIIAVGFQFKWRATAPGMGWYLYFTSPSVWRVIQEGFTILFIMSYLIPISIVVTAELLQLFLALFISQDLNLYDAESDRPSQVNATNLADELGQIEFLFSDKTGTLTQNKMDFKCYSLADDISVYNLEAEGLYLIRDCQKFSDVYKSNEIDLKNSKEIVHDEYFSSSSSEDELDENTDKAGGGEMARRCSRFKFRIEKLSETAQKFWIIAALCHTVEAKIHTIEETKEEIIAYNAESSDERALVEAASKCGYQYLGLASDNCATESERNVHLIRYNKNALRSFLKIDQTSPVLRVHVDAVIEFDSVRKRMSVMVRQEDGQCFVYTKGAEVSMLDARLCSATPSEVRDAIIYKVTNFACLGLRTLVFGMRELKLQNYEKLLSELRYAQGLIGQERSRELEAVHARIESGMTLVGVSAVEDKLQPGVRRCLRSLISAGIQVWVLTGDKEETAVQVSQAAGHFPPGLTIIRLTDSKSLEDVARAIYVQREGMQTRLNEKKRRLRWHWPSTARFSTTKEPSVNFEDPFGESVDCSTSDSELDDVEPGPYVVQRITQRFSKPVTDSLRRHNRKHPGEANEAVGLVIDGKTLRYATSPILRKDFLKLCMSVTTVLCCRMTPLQKASVVKLVRKGLKHVNGGAEPVTAAIGDGGNDVAMLLEANVGLGIFGNEGRQAARSSDYAISLFKYLRQLILVHGHWGYYRVSYLALIFYFKSVGFVALHVYHLFYNGFSGQSLFDSLIYTIFNLTMVAWSPLCFALFEQHISAKDLLHRPYLYRLMRKNANLSVWYVLLWCLDGWWHGTVCFYASYLVLAGGSQYASASFGLPGTSYAVVDNDMFGTAISIYLVVTTNIRILVASRIINLVTIIGMIVVGFANMILMMLYQTFASPYSVIYKTYDYLHACPAFWLLFPLIITFCILPDIIWRIASDAWWDRKIALSGVQSIREKRSRQRWKALLTRGRLSVSKTSA